MGWYCLCRDYQGSQSTDIQLEAQRFGGCSWECLQAQDNWNSHHFPRCGFVFGIFCMFCVQAEKLCSLCHYLHVMYFNHCCIVLAALRRVSWHKCRLHFPYMLVIVIVVNHTSTCFADGDVMWDLVCRWMRNKPPSCAWIFPSVIVSSRKASRLQKTPKSLLWRGYNIRMRRWRLRGHLVLQLTCSTTDIVYVNWCMSAYCLRLLSMLYAQCSSIGL